MKKIFCRLSILGVALFLVSTLAFAQQQQQQPSQDQKGWQCPGMQHHGMRHRGGGMGGCGQGMGNCGLGIGRMMHDNQGKPLTKDQATQIFERYVQRKNNSNLKLGEVTDKGDAFEAIITTKEGSLVEKIQMNKQTGWFRNV